MGRAWGDRIIWEERTSYFTSSQISAWWRSEIVFYFIFLKFEVYKPIFFSHPFSYKKGFHYRFLYSFMHPPSGRFSLFFNQVIEPLVSKQWFVSMEPLATKALQAVEKGELTIIPERFEKVHNNWFTIKHTCQLSCI